MQRLSGPCLWRLSPSAGENSAHALESALMVNVGDQLERVATERLGQVAAVAEGREVEAGSVRQKALVDGRALGQRATQASRPGRGGDPRNGEHVPQASTARLVPQIVNAKKCQKQEPRGSSRICLPEFADGGFAWSPVTIAVDG